MKLAVLIPDRGDRPKFLENCLRMMAAQTLKPDHIELINDPPLNNQCDITYRYRIGYERLRKKGFDLIALIENDDWYHPEYLQTMVTKWRDKGCPDIIGANYSIYYHLKERAWFKMTHQSRSSAMNTFLRPDLNFNWCKDSEPYTDIHLWQTLKGKPVHVENIVCMGMKHGEGLCGGRFHVDRMSKYINTDGDLKFMRSTLDEESFNFYSNYSIK